MHGHDADHVLLVLDDDRFETLARGDQAGGLTRTPSSLAASSTE